MKIQPTDSNSSVIKLLEACNLPVLDLKTENPNRIFFCTKLHEKVIGVIGIEIYGEVALLRSLAVSRGCRNSGVGCKLVDFVETYATEHSVKEIYLLTESVPDFFRRFGYKDLRREKVPLDIRKTDQFSNICPSAATVMKKSLKRSP